MAPGARWSRRLLAAPPAPPALSQDGAVRCDNFNLTPLRFPSAIRYITTNQRTHLSLNNGKYLLGMQVCRDLPPTIELLAPL